MHSINIVKWTQSDELPAALTAAFADDSWVPERPQGQGPRTLLWHAQDEIAVASAFALDDSGWEPLRLNHAPLRLHIWAEDDLKGFTFSAALDDGYAPGLGLPLPQPNVIVWAEPEDLVNFIATPALFESEWLILRPHAAPPVLRVWQDVDSAVPVAATPLTVDEQYWIATPLQPRVQDLRLWTTNDELFPPPTPLFVDESYWQAPPVQPRLLDPRVWQVGDEIVQPPVPLSIDDDGTFDLRRPLWAQIDTRLRSWDPGEFYSILRSLKAVRDLFMANRVQVMPKTPSEAREELLDFGPYLVPGQQVNGGTALCIVYSGTDPNPSTLVGTCTANGTQVAVPLLAAGLSGVIYAVTVYASTSNPAEQIPLCFFLAVVPEAL